MDTKKESTALTDEEIEIAVGGVSSADINYANFIDLIKGRGETPQSIPGAASGEQVVIWPKGQ